MKKLSPLAFRALFLKHVFQFLSNIFSGAELKRTHVIAVSGGVDSMALLWVAQSLHKLGKIGPIRVVFIHHHTRPGQDEDQKLVEKLCRRENIPLEVLHAEGLSEAKSNFEDKARKVRRRLLLDNLSRGEKLWLAHHLDDSYEWNFMQRHRSNNPRATLGIPVRHGPIMRPFLCVTKAQIKRLVKFEGIEYREDPTNKDLRYDRNYVRNEIIPAIRKRYPRFLRHYAHLANFSGMVLHQSINSRVNGYKIYAYEKGALIVGQHFALIQIQELIHSYSNSDRGEIVSQVVKMLKAIDNDKKGPFQFSGGVNIYHSYHMLMIYCRDMQNHDESVAQVLRQLSDQELQALPSFSRKELQRTWENLLQDSEAILNMPGLVLVLESSAICKNLNTSVYDSLFPKTSQVCQERGLRFVTASKCLALWKSKGERLPGKLRLLPLWSLSNLFSSQQ